MRIIGLVLITVVCFWPLAAGAMEVRVMAAASLREVVTEAAQQFEERYPEHKVLVNTASSGTLTRQIEAGAPADLFMSADPQWMDYLVEQDRVAAGRPLTWASNRLVVVGRGGTLTDLQDLRGFGRLAIGSPQSVPAGRYAKGMLQSVGLFRSLESEHRLVLAKDVRQALLYAEQGVVEGAIVYASDARLLQQAHILLVPNDALQPEIRYPIALTRQGETNPAAALLLALLASAEGSRLLEDYGLVPLLGTGI